MGYMINQLRTLFWSTFYYLFKPFFFEQLGTGCRFEGWIDLPQKGGAIVIGNNVRVCRMVELSVTRGATVHIADNAYLGRGVMISSHCHIEIGPRTLLAEYVCIHDNNHVFTNIHKPITEQGFASEKLIIAEDCWVGAQTVLVMGTHLQTGSIIGANSLVKCNIPAYSVAAGSPAKVLHTRAEIGQ